MIVIAGLGNPGKSYEWNRHNVGFRFIDFLVSTHGFSNSGSKWKSEVFQGMLHGQSAVLIKPQTFMNLSGQAARAVMQFYKLERTAVFTVYDDFDIPFGTVRYREKGSAGTHNGMKSMIAELGGLDIPRLRLGIGPKPEGWDVSGFVLSDFSQAEKLKLDEVFQDTDKKLAELLKLSSTSV